MIEDDDRNLRPWNRPTFNIDAETSNDVRDVDNDSNVDTGGKDFENFNLRTHYKPFLCTLQLSVVS
jgi:hypothetical protein